MNIDRHLIPRSEPPLGHVKAVDCRCKPTLVRREETAGDLAGRTWTIEVVIARHRPLRP